MTSAAGAAVAAAALLLAGCVDHQLNARQFCERHAALLAASGDDDAVRATADELKDTERAIETRMRDAEDGTRPVRRAARDLVEAYGELGSLVDDEDAEPDELRDARADLLDARADTRAACARVRVRV